MTIEHYYTKTPKSKLVDYSFSAKVFGINLKFKTASGMYSPKKLDVGSIVHIEHAIIRNKDKVLDLGCGYGAVGITIKKLYPLSSVVMVDINERAVKYAKENAALNKVKAEVFQSDVFENVKDKDFNTILLNPPVNAGLKVCYKMIGGSFEHLKLGGTLQTVLRPREGGARLINKMKSVFGNVKILGSKSIYEVWISKKESSEPASEYNRSMANYGTKDSWEDI